MQSGRIAGWILIIVGILIILYNYDIVYLTTGNILTFGLIGLGLISFIKGLTHAQRKGVLIGSFMTLFGISLLFMKYRFIPIDGDLATSAFFISLGVGNFIYFALSRNSVNNIVFGAIFIMIGIPFFLKHYYYIPHWQIREIFSTYWPVILILIGLGMVVESGLKRMKDSS
ncbi:MAG: hypothetical protein GF313_16745 [Caldithrix sp.]|nr:hypothetical protein [Caldithrix sp.]